MVIFQASIKDNNVCQNPYGNHFEILKVFVFEVSLQKVVCFRM